MRQDRPPARPPARKERNWGNHSGQSGSDRTALSSLSEDLRDSVREDKSLQFQNMCWPVVRDTFRLGVPIVLSAASKMTQVFIVSVMLGRRDTNCLAAVAVSAIWTSWVDEMLRAGHGQVAALMAHAYGAGKYALVGIWLQIGLAMTTILLPPLAMLRLFTTPVLLYLGVPQDVAEGAGLYTIWSGWALIFELWYSVINKYYTIQGVVMADAVIGVIFIGTMYVLVWYGVWVYDLGIFGLAIARSIQNVLRIVTLVVFCWWMGYHEKTWKGWAPKEVFVWDRWRILVGQALPAMLGAIAEEANWQLCALFAARLGAAKSAAFDLVMCVAILFYSVAWGLSQGTGILMARNLGQYKPKRAQAVARVGVILVYLVLVFLGSCWYYFNEAFVQMVSHDWSVQKEIRDVKLIASVMIVFSGGLMLMSEILMKQGRPGVVFVAMIPCNWFIGLPCAYHFSNRSGLKGIFLGMCCGSIVAHLALGYLVMTSEWRQLAVRARKHAEASRFVMGRESLHTLRERERAPSDTIQERDRAETPDSS